MRVKRYVVDTMPDALGQIRSELGKEAVILNTKEIRSGGFLGLFAKRKIEVIAAVDESKKQPERKASSHSQGVRAAVPKHNPYKEHSLVMQHEADPVQHPPIAQAAVATLEPRQEPAQFGRASAPQLSAADQAVRPAAARNETTTDSLLEEMQVMKGLLAQLSRDMNRSGEPVLAGWDAVRERLEEQEFDGQWIQTMCDEYRVHLQENGLESSEEQARSWTRAYLLNFLEQADVKGIQSDTKVVQFVGPTGVGKTTSIAKLAAEQSLKLQRRVGFITADTYRIAAVEQLKTYATILNVPLEVVFSPLEVRKAFEQLRECDVIFMDTAGRNYRNELFVSELNSLLNAHRPSETYLVMSLTTKFKDMKAIADNFAKFHIDRLLLTKMDETDTYGSVFNLLRTYPVSLSYMTNGQNVPDDIIPFNPSQIVDLVLGAGSHE
ncbi:flagellar biosynthesis protein FlhF [Xylanibacillus composti]|uniref:Flagellar biosynthesis protein FlhF n=1 Tax=Xylanibacillus composti TaxID=1572762 RepID=A0A8J4H308_9BACL|nr:flagellar biosynthesis protein FlhF [Xylanibacillus composti]GIQ68626.1 flagellar biosynthesis protein FlhF [Xylanibacillus composti]